MATLSELLRAEGVVLVAAGKRHARELARCMDEADVAEIQAQGCGVVEKPVRASINRSEESYAAYVGGDLLCVFGVSVYEQMQVPWMLSSKRVREHPLTVWRCMKIAIEHLRGKYPLMTNMVHARNTRALGALRRLGFTLSPPEAWGPRGEHFCRVTLVTQKIDLSIPRDLGGLHEDSLRRLIHV